MGRERVEDLLCMLEKTFFFFMLIYHTTERGRRSEGGRRRGVRRWNKVKIAVVMCV